MENVLFGKRLSELTRADIERIVTEQVQESSEVELKETLPAKKGQDSWLRGEKRIGDYARNEIVAEVIAFANAYGGTFVVGVKETSDKPARAAITGSKALVGPHGRFNIGCFTMLLDKLVGGAVDVEVGGHQSAGSNTSVGPSAS